MRKQSQLCPFKKACPAQLTVSISLQSVSLFLLLNYSEKCCNDEKVCWYPASLLVEMRS